VCDQTNSLSFFTHLGSGLACYLFCSRPDQGHRMYSMIAHLSPSFPFAHWRSEESHLLPCLTLGILARRFLEMRGPKG
jgi:hypothetical protein